jgi:hypothetical protein
MKSDRRFTRRVRWKNLGAAREPPTQPPGAQSKPLIVLKKKFRTFGRSPELWRNLALGERKALGSSVRDTVLRLNKDWVISGIAAVFDRPEKFVVRARWRSERNCNPTFSIAARHGRRAKRYPGAFCWCGLVVETSDTSAEPNSASSRSCWR